MAAVPVRITSATTRGAHVHALINSNRIGCYLPVTTTEQITPAEMVEQHLTACSYCWPVGIIWPRNAS